MRIVILLICIAMLQTFAIPSEKHTLAQENYYPHSVESYPAIQITEEDQERGFFYTQEIAQEFLMDKLLEEFSIRFRQDIPKGWCFGISCYLATKDPIVRNLNPDQKKMVIYFQSYVTALELLKEKVDMVKEKGENPTVAEIRESGVNPYYLLVKKIENDIYNHFSIHGKKLSLPKLFIRNDLIDQQFYAEVLEYITQLIFERKVQSILLCYSSKNSGHSILVHLDKPEIYDPSFGGYFYPSKTNQILDLLKNTTQLRKAEKIWILNIENEPN